MKVKSLHSFIHKSGREFTKDEVTEVTDANAIELINQKLVEPIDKDKVQLLKEAAPDGLELVGPGHKMK